MSAIRNILFDIGRVLVHLDYEKALAQAARFCDPTKLGKDARAFAILSRDPVLAEYERGHIAVRDYYEHFVSQTGFSGDYDQFLEIWQSIFAENTPMIEFGRELARDYDVYFLSNTGDIHFPYLYETFPALKFCKDDALSCDLGELKPERAYYEKALAKFGLEAAECLFIDDLPENVAGAEACGIRSLLYTSPDETIPAIRDVLANS